MEIFSMMLICQFLLVLINQNIKINNSFIQLLNLSIGSEHLSVFHHPILSSHNFIISYNYIGLILSNFHILLIILKIIILAIFSIFEYFFFAIIAELMSYPFSSRTPGHLQVSLIWAGSDRCCFLPSLWTKLDFCYCFLVYMKWWFDFNFNDSQQLGQTMLQH